MNIVKFLKLFQNKLFRPMISLFLILSITLFFFVPNRIESVIQQQQIVNSSNMPSHTHKNGAIIGNLSHVQKIDEEVKESIKDTRNEIIFMVIFSVSILFFYYGGVVSRRENELTSENEELTDRFNDVFRTLSSKNNEMDIELETIYENVDKYVIYSNTDLFGVITEASEAFSKISGYSKKELIGKAHSIVRHPDMDKKAFKDMWEILDDDRVWTGIVKNLRKDGGFYIVKAIITPMYDSEGIKIGYNAIRQDITNEVKK